MVLSNVINAILYVLTIVMVTPKIVHFALSVPSKSKEIVLNVD